MQQGLNSFISEMGQIDSEKLLARAIDGTKNSEKIAFWNHIKNYTNATDQDIKDNAEQIINKAKEELKEEMEQEE